MPHYLARIAAAGMRTSTQAVPPVAGPPILPGHRPPSFTVATGIEQGEGDDVQGDVNEVQVVPAFSAAAGKPMSASAPESALLQEQTPSNIDATPVIQAPRILRPISTPHPDASQVNKEIYPGVSTSPTSSMGSAIPSPATPGPSPVAPHVKQSTGIGPVLPGASLPHEVVMSSDRLPMASVYQDKQVTQSTAAQATDGARHEREYSVLPTQGRLKQATTLPMPPAQASTSLMPPATAASRQVKLTIGRLDVQVHNRQPALPARRSAPAVSNTGTDALEQRYLDRFRLKL